MNTSDLILALAMGTAIGIFVAYVVLMLKEVL